MTSLRRWLPLSPLPLPLLLLLLLLSTTLGACAALPEVSLPPERVTGLPSVTGSKGPLTAERTRALLERRWPKGRLDLQAQAALEEAATGVPLIAGNKATLLFDGPQTMAAMRAAIAAARDSINLETYIFDEDELGLQFAELLMEKQRQGVTVNIMYDSVGTLAVPAAFFERMREAGIHLLAFNPVGSAAWKLNQRDHRKLLIVDGRIAFTGGINISASYTRGSLFRSRPAAREPAQSAQSPQPGWRDTHVMIEGPAVAACQWLFVRQWVAQDAAELPLAEYFPPPQVAGDKLLRVLGSDPGDKFEIYRAYSLALQAARRSIHLTSAYFVPDQQTVAALTAAARRGVDVRLVLPGVSDNGIVFQAGHAFYDELLDSGVRIFHLKRAVLHAKTAVIDGNWSTVGSANIDRRSFLHNSELNVIVLGSAFGAEMETAFAEDLRGSTELSLQQWRQRPLLDRLKEWAASLAGYWL